VDSFNVLLMNFAGFERPLQTTSLNVGSNSSVVVQSSALEVINTDTNGTTGNVFLGGTFNHGDFSQVKVHGRLDVGGFSHGAYFFTNGTLSVHLDEHIGGFGPGNFVQYGGVNNVATIQVSREGQFDIYEGQVTATNGITVGFGDFATSSGLHQYGGSVNADTVINGRYVLMVALLPGACLCRAIRFSE
jgi:hypothetical protein